MFFEACMTPSYSALTTGMLQNAAGSDLANFDRTGSFPCYVSTNIIISSSETPEKPAVYEYSIGNEFFTKTTVITRLTKGRIINRIINATNSGTVITLVVTFDDDERIHFYFVSKLRDAGATIEGVQYGTTRFYLTGVNSTEQPPQNNHNVNMTFTGKYLPYLLVDYHQNAQKTGAPPKDFTAHTMRRRHALPPSLPNRRKTAEHFVAANRF
ncbi:MAG: hypothetical protein LBC77_03800 [Spirochaetaceae bacterium]|nr:hypothetical protein [Spirochaetaceae bacterium]